VKLLRRTLLSLTVVLLCLSAHARNSNFAQEAPPRAELPSVARFELPASGLEWKQAVHPGKFFDATGRRAGVFGKQNGHFEAWIYPIKLLHAFRLEFRQEGMPEPVRGENILEQIIAQPESTTFVYAHPRFTVRQILWVPRDEKAIAIFFDVDTDRPLAITAKFIPDFKPMWPASFGGQYSYWLDAEKAFALTDATSRPTALVGSPAVGAFTEHMDHAFVGGEMLLQLRVTRDDARKTFPSIVMTLSMESAAKARETYRRVLGRLRELYEQRVAYHRDFLARTLRIETPDAELNRALEWAKVAIDAGWVCHDAYGCGLVAGYGPSGESERPGFAWWFGGDALMASWAMLDYGDIEGAAQVLRFLKARQRADGKIMHEMTQSVDLVDWFGKFGFAYYHADTTPMYIYSVAEYWRRTGDSKFLDEFWPSVKKAFEYCLSTVDPADGLMDNTKAGLAAVEVGPLRGKVVKDVYLQGFWLAGLGAVPELATAQAETELRSKAIKLYSQAAESVFGKWWNEKGAFFDFGVTRERELANRFGSWPAVLLSLLPSPGKYEKRAGQGAAALTRPELTTDWGARWLSNRDPLYDPLSYNNGSVWPFINGFVSLAHFAHEQALSGFFIWNAVARMTGALAPGALPELYTGDRYRPTERAVPHQLFSSVGVVRGAVRGVLGIRGDRTAVAPHGIYIEPQLPASWPFARFRNYPVGASQVSGEILAQAGRMSIRLEFDGRETVECYLSPRLPLGTRIKRVLLDGKKVGEWNSFVRGESTVVWWRFALAGRHEIIIEYEGGIAFAPPEAKLEVGDVSSALRILQVEYDGDGKPREASLALAGLGGKVYTLHLVTTEKALVAEGAAVKKTEQGFRLEIAFQGEGHEYVTKTIRLRW
jgi:glycogen debranching enzyme